ncbi:TPA: MAP domain-containing protein [Staphylococcus aureus]|uniref:MAP domain-containing protein n=1 Tax=Staphylococcus TaxID=1279 RepID=UPI000D1A5463|nr:MULTISPECIES: MAP domain-containing protein [Staphylococcus]MCO4356264.1 MAP domain-containing protein [Staphylococcus agnetis]NDP53348.1 MAP domain-containing protein [Staphylococcus aureus]NDQ34051.1 MAP domain-containing protein [Staphylococcus aureus]NDQ44681.1 MAP domain-containing protein [Staphylococcus aureus]NJH85930.1 MAP domain-containing protein [Staphylococcus agnetis]
MKIKSLITATLALGILTTGSATLLNNEASAAQYEHHFQENTVPYTITVNGMTALSLTDFDFSKNGLVSYYDINQKVKLALKSDRGIDEATLKKAKSAEYKVHFKNGKAKTMDLKSKDLTANLLDTDSIKNIDVNIQL